MDPKNRTSAHRKVLRSRASMRIRWAIIGGATTAVLLPVVARADFVWPAMVLEGRILTWWAIALGLVAEWPVVRHLTRTGWRKSFLLNALTNLASTLVGIVLIPAAGFILSMSIVPGFSPVPFVIAALFAAAVNAAVEGLVLRVAVNLKYTSRVFWWLFGANLVSVAAAMASLLVSPPQL
jgi:hypothetical protein